MPTRIAFYAAAMLIGLHWVTPARAAAQGSASPCITQKGLLTGNIIGPDGEPIADAHVRFYGLEWRDDCSGGVYRWFETTTDSAGSYWLRVPVGKGSLIVQHPNGVRFPPEAMTLEEVVSGTNRADHRFRIYHIQGRVLGPGGVPLSQGTVTYYPDPGGAMICGTGLPEAKVDDGVFTAQVHHTGKYLFWVQPVPRNVGIPYLTHRAQIVSDTAIVISLDGPTVAGTIRGQGGRPLVGATVSAAGSAYAEVKTDSSGGYSLHLPAGTYRWTVEPLENYIQTWRAPDFTLTGPTRLDLAEDAVQWLGTVLDSLSGTGLDSVHVYAYEGGRDVNTGHAWCETDSRGRFRLVVRRGKVFDMYLEDMRSEVVPKRATRDIQGEQDRVERQYARVQRKWIFGIHAGNDSTFAVKLRTVRH